MQTAIIALEQQNEDLLELTTGQSSQILELQQKNDVLQNQIKELEAKVNNSPGLFHSLEEAYEKGFITFEDLKSIAYYKNGGIGNNEEILGKDFVPQELAPLTDDIKYKIKETEAQKYREDKKNPRPQTKAEDIEIEGYCGFYNGYYIVMLCPNFISYSTVFDEVNYYGIKIGYACKGQVLVAWKEIN